MSKDKNASRDDLIVPLNKLVSFEGNIYEMTNAAISRSRQIAMTGDPILEKNKGKVVSSAIEQIVKEDVKYRLEE